MNKASLRLMRLPSLSMPPAARYVSVVLAILISLHYILSFTHESYGRNTSVATILDQLGLNNSDTQHYPDTSSGLTFPPAVTPGLDNYDFPYPQKGTANATFVFLARNSDLEGVVSSVRQMEDRFNRKYNYPWVFLNDEPFSEEFIRRVTILSNAKMQFGLIPAHHWHQPEWIDEKKAEEGRNNMVENNIIYGGSVPYRNMCRFNSGFFYQHELLKPYRYYWRVEPHVKFFCDLDYDPFAFMVENNKTYGFTLSMLEYRETIPTLWDRVQEFITDHPHYVSADNSMGFLSDNGGWSYNMCHFWSNFEIADMEFWRSEAYTAFFDFLDQNGGFYYERWGDAPVHSIAAGLFARKDQLHFFKDIGYQHDSFAHCPQGGDWDKGRCSCDPSDNFDYTFYSCLRRWERLFE